MPNKTATHKPDWETATVAARKLVATCESGLYTAPELINQRLADACVDLDKIRVALHLSGPVLS